MSVLGFDVNMKKDDLLKMLQDYNWEETGNISFEDFKSCDQPDTGYKFTSKAAQRSSFLVVMTNNIS